MIKCVLPTADTTDPVEEIGKRGPGRVELECTRQAILFFIQLQLCASRWRIERLSRHQVKVLFDLPFVFVCCVCLDP